MFRILIATAVALLIGTNSGWADDKSTYRIGVPKSFFRDVPPELAALAGQPFQELFKEQTGLEGEIVQDADALSVARKVDSGEQQLAVLFGHEFAWAKEKYPDLQPIVVAINRPKDIKAMILVRYDCKASSLKDMPEAKVATTKVIKDYACLYLDKVCTDEMGGKAFKSESAATVHDCIHKVIDGSADLTVADAASWAYFEKLYPGPSKNVRVLSQSAEFPAAVMVCKKGAIEEAALKKIRDGFMAGHENAKAKRVLTAIHIEKFDAVPSDYDDRLKECLKAYPKPLDEKLAVRSSAGK